MKAQKVPQWVRDKVADRSKWICERCGKHRATEIHHRTGRQMGGSREPWVNLPANLLHLDDECHREVTNTNGQREFHETCGWLVRRGVRLPSEIPVVLWHGLVLLDDQGGMTPALKLGGVT